MAITPRAGSSASGMTSLETPVALVIFNRPDCTARSLAAIRAARPRRLFVIADGPRAERPGEAELCAEVRALVELGVDWECEVVRDYSADNLGCARRVASGLDGVFSQVDAAIVLEDDCVADPTFFPFCAELLGRYRDADSVWHIGGANFQATPLPDRYYFSRYNHVWGWATWKRAWSHFDWNMKEWPRLRGTRWLAELLGDTSAAKYWRDAFDAVHAGRVNSWAYRWTYSLWRGGGLAVTAGVNLVQNIGFDAAATHMRKTDAKLSRPTRPIIFPLHQSTASDRDIHADDYSEQQIFSGGWVGSLRRGLHRLRRSIVRS
jgi:hypothetical protein